MRTLLRAFNVFCAVTFFVLTVYALVGSFTGRPLDVRLMWLAAANAFIAAGRFSTEDL